MARSRRKNKRSRKSYRKSRKLQTRLDVSSPKDVLCKRRIPKIYTQAISVYKEVKDTGFPQDKFYLEIPGSEQPYKDLEALEKMIHEYVNGDCHGITVDDELVYSSDTAGQSDCIRKRNFETIFRDQIASKPYRFLLDPVSRSKGNRIIRIFMHDVQTKGEGAFLQLTYDKKEDCFIVKWFDDKE